MSLALRLAAALALTSLAGCGAVPASLQLAPAKPAVEKKELALDPAASPVPFRRLRRDAILVPTSADARKLAELGNYIAAAAEPLPSAHVVVYSDAEPFKEHSVPDSIERRPAAEYRKTAGTEGMDRFVVYAADGSEEYARNFRDWPLARGD